MSRIALVTFAFSLLLPMNTLPDQKDIGTQTILDQVQLNDEVRAQIAIIELVGGLNVKKTMLDLISAAKDKNIRGIVLLIDSRGGEIPQFATVHDLIKKTKETKPVVAFVVGSALSCGYMLASASDYIVASSGADIGSVGVILHVERWKKPRVTGNVEADIEMENFAGGAFKDIYDVYAPRLTGEQRRYIKERTDKAYQYFIKTVADNRSLELKDYKQWAEGKVFLSSDALAIGLIDEIGTVFDVENKLIELINERNPMCAVTDLDYNFEVADKN